MRIIVCSREMQQAEPWSTIIEAILPARVPRCRIPVAAVPSNDPALCSIPTNAYLPGGNWPCKGHYSNRKFIAPA